MAEPISAEPAVRVNPRRRPLHPDISEDLIRTLVETFYAKVRADSRLGPIFEAVLPDRWDHHIDTMCTFWSSVTRMSGRYKGKPMVAHMKLVDAVTPEDFGVWLTLFRRTAREICPPEIAGIFVARAENIAESLKLGMFTRTPLMAAAGERSTARPSRTPRQ